MGKEHYVSARELSQCGILQPVAPLGSYDLAEREAAAIISKEKKEQKKYKVQFSFLQKKLNSENSLVYQLWYHGLSLKKNR